MRGAHDCPGHVRYTLESRALPTPYTLDRTGLPYRLTGVAANRTHTLTLATRPGTPRDARRGRDSVYAVYRHGRRHRAPMCVCVALRDGRWDPHESRDQLICAVPNSFLRQLSGEAEQRARRDAPVGGTGPRASGSPPRPPRFALCGFAPPDRCAMIVRCTEMPLLAIFAGGNHGLPIARGQEPFLCLSRLGILSCGGFVQGAFPL